MSELTRRRFLQGTGLAAGGLIMGCALRPNKSAVSLVSERSFEGAAFDAWLQITPDDRILLQLDKVEMGQGTTTGFATLLAEELEVDPAFGGLRCTSSSSSRFRSRVGAPAPATHTNPCVARPLAPESA